MPGLARLSSCLLVSLLAFGFPFGCAEAEVAQEPVVALDAPTPFAGWSPDGAQAAAVEGAWAFDAEAQVAWELGEEKRQLELAALETLGATHEVFTAPAWEREPYLESGRAGYETAVRQGLAAMSVQLGPEGLVIEDSRTPNPFVPESMTPLYLASGSWLYARPVEGGLVFAAQNDPADLMGISHGRIVTVGTDRLVVQYRTMGLESRLYLRRPDGVSADCVRLARVASFQFGVGLG